MSQDANYNPDEPGSSKHLRERPGHDSERGGVEEELRESRRRLATLMSNLPGIAYRCLNDHDWTMLFVSDGAKDVCGYSAEEFTSGAVIWNQLICPDDRKRVWREVQGALADRVPFRVEYRIRHADGAVRWMWEQGSGVFEDGKLVALEGFISDITARKTAEQDLQEADRRKDQFLALLGHELRNPLTAISSASELLVASNGGDPTMERIHNLLSRQSLQMKRIIDGLLDVSRITRGKIELHTEKVDLIEVLENLLEDRAAQLSARSLEVSIAREDEPMWLDADPVRLGQVFDNLLTNAVKFTGESDAIELRAERRGDHAIVQVIDSGVGIEPELLPHIFEPFQQAPQDIARSRGGIGLGLALAKGLVEMHGGQIEGYSEGQGEGARFEVRLPLASPPSERRDEQAEPSGESRHVLIIEDDSDIADVLTLLLARIGHQAQVALTAPQGLSLAHEQRPDLVICDLGLPGMSGYEFAEKLRADEPIAQLPLVALTGYGGSSVRQRALEAGFDEHITKPVTMDQLAEVCERLCRD